MKSIVAALAALAFAVVSAQQTGIVSVTSPVSGTVFTAGEEATISWNADTATVDTIAQIQLANGNPNNLNLLDVLVTDIDSSEGSYTWSVPEDIEPAANYAIVFGIYPDVAYSPQFTIAAADGSLPSSSAVSSAAPSSSAVISSASPISVSSARPSSSAARSSSAVRSASVPHASASKTASPSATPSDSAGTQSKPAAVAAFAIVGAAAMIMI